MKETGYNSTNSSTDQDDIEATDEEMRGVGYFGLILLVGLAGIVGLVGYVVL